MSEVVANLLNLCYIISELHLTPRATNNNGSPCSVLERDSKPFLCSSFWVKFWFFCCLTAFPCSFRKKNFLNWLKFRLSWLLAFLLSTYSHITFFQRKNWLSQICLILEELVPSAESRAPNCFLQHVCILGSAGLGTDLSFLEWISRTLMFGAEKHYLLKAKSKTS